MKKILFILTICMIVSTCSGCNKIKEITGQFIGNGDSNNELDNPMIAYASLNEINEMIGVEIVGPDSSDVNNEEYYVIDDRIAQYNFELDGCDFTIRGAYITDEDISGLYDDETNDSELELDYPVYTDEYYLYKFFDGSKQYTIVVSTPKRIDEETFSSICTELEESVRWNANDPLIGDYQEISNESATCRVERNANKKYSIYINWSNSANEYLLWTMKVRLDDNNKLVYSKEEIETYDYSMDDPLISDDLIQYDGYFEFKDDKLYWMEASQEHLKECIFEKVYN